MNPLLLNPTQEQLALLQTASDAHQAHGAWPIFQYVEILLDRRHDLDALSVLASMPEIRDPARGLASYAWTWMVRSGGAAPQPDAPIGLTVAGMSRIPRPLPYVAWFITALSAITDRQRRISPSPTEVVASDMPMVEIVDSLIQAGHTPLPAGASATVREMLLHEPPTWGLIRDHHATEWSVELRPSVRRYRGVLDVDDYVERVTLEMAGSARLVRSLPSPLALPAALDHLDVTWRVLTRRPLFSSFGTMNAVKTALPCATADEFDSRLSALADILNHMAIPTNGLNLSESQRSVERLRLYLLIRLPDESHERVNRSTQMLKDLMRIRAGTQHRGVTADAALRFERLGLSYPPASLMGTWEQIQAIAVEALDAIREEIQTNLLD